jgi:hypothetical protein
MNQSNHAFAEKLGTVIGWFLVLCFVYAVFFNDKATTPKEKYPETHAEWYAYYEKLNAERAKPEAMKSQLTFGNAWTSERQHDMFLALRNIKLVNPTPHSYKDIEITCEGFAASGTKIDKNIRVQYVIVPANQTIDLGTVEMGFLHDQVKEVECKITNAKQA